MTSRWKHPTETVTAGQNSQVVRALTHRERMEFAKKSSEIKDGKFSKHDLPALIAGFGCVDLDPKDLEDMPGDLLDACVGKIMELTGLKNEPEKPGEKKA